MGYPRTADPCRLIGNLTELRRFGNPNLVSDEFGFEQCNIIVKDDSLRQSDITVLLANGAAPEGPPPPTQNKGRFSLVQDQPGDGFCQRRLLLPDNYEIRIRARRDTMRDADFCGMADVATGWAATVITQGQIPRRAQTDPRSLVTVDACEAASSADFPMVRGMDTANPQIGFGHWHCVWTSTAESTTLGVGYGRRKPLNESGGRHLQIAGRPAIIDEPGSDAPGNCGIQVFNLAYDDTFGSPRNEVVFIDATSDRKTHEELCDLATRLATASFPPR